MKQRIFVTALVLAAAACSNPAPDVASREEPVVGGRHERGLEAAGYLVREGFTSCTGVLIEPDLVLTAGHCVAGHQEIDFGWGEICDHSTVRSIAQAVHPRYVHPPVNGGVAFQGFDVALLRLAEPVPVLPAALGAVTPPARVHGVGYGATSYVREHDGGSLQPRGAGTERRSLDGRVESESPTEMFVHWNAGSSACYGDSGGPLFTDDGKVVGILSRFTEIGRCLPKDHSLMGYVRVDAMEDFFRAARDCMSEVDVQGCLRQDQRHLCAPAKFEMRDASVLDPSAEERGTKKIELADREARTIEVRPKKNVELVVDADGDALLRVREVGSAELSPARSRARLEGGRDYEVVLGSCNGKAQSVVLRWQPPVRERVTPASR